MSISYDRSNLAALSAGLVLALAIPQPTGATAPVVGEGECLYLVGAPPGAPEAATEERAGDAGLFNVCNREAGAVINRDAENLAQAWILEDLGSRNAIDSCRAFAWVGHAFEVGSSPAQLLPGSVAMNALLRGVLDTGSHGDPWYTGALAHIEVVELSETGTAVAASAEVFREAIPEGVQFFDEPIGRRLDLALRPGRTYQARLYLEVWTESAGGTLAGFERHEPDFGRFPRDGRGVRYDSIEVCVGTPSREEEILDRVETLEDLVASLAAAQGREDLDRLEWELLNKDCRPGLWLPEDRGGRLEEAREHVASRIEAAEGDPGVNTKVARDRIAEADALIAEGRHQKACQRISDALRALTTP